MVDLAVDDADRQLAASHPFGDARRVGDGDFGLYQRIPGFQVGDDVRQDVFAEGVAGADGQFAAGLVNGVVDESLHLGVEAEDLVGVVEDDFAGLVGMHGLAAAVEQLGADVALDQLDVLADRRLGHVQGGGRLGEALFFDDGDENAQRLFHRSNPLLERLYHKLIIIGSIVMFYFSYYGLSSILSLNKEISRNFFRRRAEWRKGSICC